jgi:AraC-like DNA-binding protein
MFSVYPPDIRLSHLIETYWVFDGMIENPYAAKVLPDGCVDIIFDFGENDGTGRLQTGVPELIGTMTSPLHVSYRKEKVRMMGICFAPAGITAFTRMPVFEFTNQNISLPLSETLFDKKFYERLPDMNCMQERIDYLNQYFLARLHKFYVPDIQIGHAVSMIRANNGQQSVKKIAKEVCLCERHFERKFKSAIGISPKMFSRIIRFKYTIDYLQTCSIDNMYNVAIDCGYFDHSHLIKDFKAFGGTLPAGLM